MRWIAVAAGLLALAACSASPVPGTSAAPGVQGGAPAAAARTAAPDSGATGATAGAAGSGATGTGTAAGAASAPTRLKIASGGRPLTIRHLPSTTGFVLKRLASGSTATIACTARGGRVLGTQGSTDVWDFVADPGTWGFVSAAYVVGGAGPTLPACPFTAAIATAPRPLPDLAGRDLAQRAIAIARSQVGVAERAGNCNPYTRACEAWCAHFATWAWRKAGVSGIGDVAFTGALYQWGKARGRTQPGSAAAGPGDLVLYGTGPQTTASSIHVDLVVAAYPDHLHVIGGNVGDRVTERDVPRAKIYATVAIGP